MKPLLLNIFATMGIAAVTCVIILIIAASAPPPAVEAEGIIVSANPQSAAEPAPKPKSSPWNSLVSAFRKRLLATANNEAAKQAAAPRDSGNEGTPHPTVNPDWDDGSEPEDSFTGYSPSVATTHIANASDRKIGGSGGKSGTESASTQKIRGFMGSSGGGGGGSGGGGGGSGGGGGGGGGESYEEKLAKSLGESLTPAEIDELIANQQSRAEGN